MSEDVQTAEAPAALPPGPANYHVSLWDEPMPTYLCLLCSEVSGVTEAEVRVHVRAAHEQEPVPSMIISALAQLRPIEATSAEVPPDATAAVPDPAPVERGP